MWHENNLGKSERGRGDESANAGGLASISGYNFGTPRARRRGV